MDRGSSLSCAERMSEILRQKVTLAPTASETRRQDHADAKKVMLSCLTRSAKEEEEKNEPGLLEKLAAPDLTSPTP
jgi:hypothetical protein